MKADGLRLDGAATSAGAEEGRAGRVLNLCRRRVRSSLSLAPGPCPGSLSRGVPYSFN